MSRHQQRIFTAICCMLLSAGACAQDIRPNEYWHGIERSVRYHPEGKDFVISNGSRRFTRALYGTNTAFRVETGDLPDFALYMPGMGGSLKLALVNDKKSKWLSESAHIVARYTPGRMQYEITDSLLGKGKLTVTVLAMGDAEGIILKITAADLSSPLTLQWVFGGASGKKFSRDGDMGPDPESVFYLKPEYCADNHYTIRQNSFMLSYGTGLPAEWDPYINKNLPSDTVKPVKPGKEQKLVGVFPPASVIKVSDAGSQAEPELLFGANAGKSPVITGRWPLKNKEVYFIAVQKPDAHRAEIAYAGARNIFENAETARKKIADRIEVLTPDPYINTLGGVLATAGDAIWEAPTFLHGSIGWRMRLNGWRGPYTGDVLGWHDRAKLHFQSYARSQVTTPLVGPVIMDTALHLARSLEKMGTSIYSSGYICRNPDGDFRPHHYDMNLVYTDALIRHFFWTGDLVFAKEIWPVIKRHLAWEKRNFDPDDDGLYDAYAAIWASDALEYSGGAVTHSSAYNYKANKEAAVVARLIGEDDAPYKKEAQKILRSINKTLWMPGRGCFAEYKDLLGNRLLHPSAALWTLYHSIDSDVPDAFQAYQCIQYADHYIPHIPVRAKGLESGYATVSTTSWMPYDWSLNNVATAEVMHTSLAFWQAGDPEKAFRLWKSELLSTMYLGGSPGNIGQISFYDAARGEAYRDFADPVAMTARSTIEGLFGIRPNALNNELLITPGFPATWDSASILTPDIYFHFRRVGNTDVYSIRPGFEKSLQLKLCVPVYGDSIQKIMVNGKAVAWSNTDNAIGHPAISIRPPVAKTYNIKITRSGKAAKAAGLRKTYVHGSEIELSFPGARVLQVKDPQQVLASSHLNGAMCSGVVAADTGHHTFFVQLKQGQFTCWYPVNINISHAVDIQYDYRQTANKLQFRLVNNTSAPLNVQLLVNGRQPATNNFSIPADTVSSLINISAEQLVPGTNQLQCQMGPSALQTFNIITWNLRSSVKLDTIGISAFFNDNIDHIFRNQYLSPRPATATLQLPVQGIGDWTHPLKTAEIDDRGLRKLAGDSNQILLPQGIVFSTPSDSTKRNIIFTSQWHNYPNQVNLPLSGSASHMYLLMAGSTNPMQSRITNGMLSVMYTDGSTDSLALQNPQNWWPIEQDYLDDGYAFRTDAPKPVRIHLKTGKIVSALDNSIDAYNGKMIDGGAATVLDLPLNKNKRLQSMQLRAIANDVVIGLMSVTLQRN